MKVNKYSMCFKRALSLCLTLLTLLLSLTSVIYADEDIEASFENTSKGKYADDEVLILLKNCEENKKAEFHLVYSDDKNYFKTHEKTLLHDVAPTSEFVDALSVDLTSKKQNCSIRPC